MRNWEMDVPGLTSREWRSGTANVAMEFLVSQRHRTADGDRILVDALEVEPGDLVVDVGCGTGEMVERLTDLHAGVTVVGVDVMPGLLEVGRRGSPAAIWVCGQADALPFGRQTVDRVLVQRLLLHLPRWRGVVAEVARVLRPGGTLVISEPTWSRFEFVSDDPKLDAKLVALMQSGVAVPDIGERLAAAVHREPASPQ